MVLHLMEKMRDSDLTGCVRLKAFLLEYLRLKMFFIFRKGRLDTMLASSSSSHTADGCRAWLTPPGIE